MATPKTILQRIALEGAEEIRRLLTDIGSVGERAMQQISAATAPTTKSLEGLSKAVATVQAAVAKVADAGRQFGGALGQIGKAGNDLGSAVSTMALRIAAGLTVAGGAFVALAKSSADSADEIIKNAQAAGLTVERYQALRFAAAQSGLDMEQFGRGITAFSKQVVEAAKAEAQALLGFVDQVKKVKAEPGVFRIDPTRDVAAEFKVISDAAQKLQNDLKALGVEQPLFRIRAELQKLADGGAEAREKFKELTGVALPSLAGGLDALRDIAKGGGDALKQLGVRTTEVVDGIVRVRDTEAVLLEVAEAFSKLADGPRKVAISTDLLSKLGPKWAAFLNSGRDGINALTEDFKKSGLTLTKEQTRIGEAMNDAISRMGTFAKAVKDQLGLLFAPTITQAADELSKVILANSRNIIKFGESIRDKVLPYVQAFLVLIGAGDPNAIKLPGFDDAKRRLEQLRDAVLAFYTTVKGAVTDILIPAFAAFMKVLDGVAAVINSVFGTQLTGSMIAVALVVAQITGAFAVLFAAVKLGLAVFVALAGALRLIVASFALISAAVRVVAVALAAFVSLPVAIVAAFAIAVALIVAYWDEITSAVSRTWDYIKEIVSAGISGAWQWIKDAAVAVWDAVKTKANEAWESVKKLITESVSGAWQWVVDAFDRVVETIKQKAIELAEFLKRTLTQSPEVAPSPTAPTAGTTQGVPLVGNQQQQQRDPRSGFDRMPQSPDIEDRRGEGGQQLGELEAQGRAMLERLAEFGRQVAETVATAMSALVTSAQQSAQSLVETYVGAGDLIGQLLVGSVQRAADGINQVINAIGQALQAVLDTLRQGIGATGDQILTMIGGIIAQLEAAIAKARELAAAIAAAGGGGGGGNTGEGAQPGGFVAGGYTGDGDIRRIAGVVHGREYVEPAHVVAKPGVLGFLEALRRSGGNLAAVVERFRGYAAGGFVSGLESRFAGLAMPLPGFAAGGFVPAPAGAQALPYLGTVGLDLGGGVVVQVAVDGGAVEQLQRAGVNRRRARLGKTMR